jgi:hypothetical protein
VGIGRRRLSVPAAELQTGIVLDSSVPGASGEVGGTEGLRKIENKERNLRRLAVNAMTGTQLMARI